MPLISLCSSKTVQECSILHLSFSSDQCLFNSCHFHRLRATHCYNDIDPDYSIKKKNIQFQRTIFKTTTQTELNFFKTTTKQQESLTSPSYGSDRLLSRVVFDHTKWRTNLVKKQVKAVKQA